MIRPHPGGVGDCVHEKIGATEGIGRVDLVHSLARYLDPEVTGYRQQLSPPIHHLGQDDDVGSGAAEVPEAPFQVVGKVLPAVTANDEVDPVTRCQRGHRPGVLHLKVRQEGEGDQGCSCENQEDEDPNRPALARAVATATGFRRRRARRGPGSGVVTHDDRHQRAGKTVNLT